MEKNNGDIVRIINIERSNFDDLGVITGWNEYSKRYIVSFPNGFASQYDSYEIAVQLNRELETILIKEHLYQLLDIALEIRDQEWAREIAQRIYGM